MIVLKKNILTILILFIYACGGGGGGSTQSVALNVDSISPPNGSASQFGAINYDSFLDISAQVSGGASDVECLIDGQSYGKKYAAPYSWEVNIIDNNIIQGAHLVTIRAQDSNGNIATSSASINSENYFFVRITSTCVQVSTGFDWYITPVTQDLNPFYNFFYGSTANIGTAGGSDHLIQEGTYNLRIVESDTGNDIADFNFDINTQTAGNWSIDFALAISNNQYTLSIN